MTLTRSVKAQTLNNSLSNKTYMTLIKSISGIRGTIGGRADEGLTPLDVVKLTSAYAALIRKTTTKTSNKIVVGRDARLSGSMVNKIVCGTLMGMGFDVVDIGLASTPTTEVAVTMEDACGGIILTASHNPRQWNALKLLNEKGEFLNAAEGQEVLRIAAAEEFDYADVETLGKYRLDESYDDKHIDAVLALPLVDVEAIKAAGFKVAIDCVNSVGGVILPKLFEKLGCFCQIIRTAVLRLQCRYKAVINIFISRIRINMNPTKNGSLIFQRAIFP